MAEFEYIAKDNNNKLYKGKLEATDEAALRRRLKENGFYVTSVSVKREPFFSSFLSPIKPDDLVTFSQQFAGMLGAGLPIIKCLQVLEKQTESARLRKVINQVKLDIESGVSFTDALSKHPKVFSNFFVSLISAGEKGGQDKCG